MYKTIIMLLVLAYPVVSFSAIQILDTRIILNADEKEQSFVIRNTGNSPSLLQVWLSDKDNASMEIKDNIPLTITPPVARINVGRSKVFRIFTTEDVTAILPQDRESVFWVNALDVPSVDEADSNGNRLNIAFRTRIKAFYRPSKLQGSSTESAEKMKWSLRKEGKDHIYTVENNEPYHISLAGLYLDSGKKKIASLSGVMIEPYSSKEFTFRNIIDENIQLNYKYITDLGAFVSKVLK